MLKKKDTFVFCHGGERNSVEKKVLDQAKTKNLLQQRIQEKKERRSWQQCEEKYSETSASKDENQPDLKIYGEKWLSQSQDDNEHLS